MYRIYVVLIQNPSDIAIYGSDYIFGDHPVGFLPRIRYIHVMRSEVSTGSQYISFRGQLLYLLIMAVLLFSPFQLRYVFCWIQAWSSFFW